MIPKSLLNFLKVCFFIAIASMVLYYSIAFRFLKFEDITGGYFSILKVFYFTSTTFWFILFGYTVYFFFKYDRYSKSGFFFFFFNVFYSLFYFYNVIWKQKRGLIGTINYAPVSGQTIYIESDESAEISEEEGKEDWRQSWLVTIDELTSIGLQKTKRFVSEADDQQQSFKEILANYFENILCDTDYSHFLKIGWISETEYNIVKDWHLALSKYQAPDDNIDLPATIVRDSKWVDIVEQGKTAKQSLLNVLTTKEKEYLTD